MDSYRGFVTYRFVVGFVAIACLLTIGCVSSGSSSTVLTDDPDLLAQVSKEQAQVDNASRAEVVKVSAKVQKDPKSKWTLQECVAYACENNEKIKSLKAKKEALRGKIIEAWSGYLPAGQFKYAHSNTSEAGEADYYQIKGKTLLWDSGKTKSRVKKLEAEQKMFDEAKREEMLELAYRIKKSYFEMLYAQYQASAQKANLESAKSKAEALTGDVQRGVGRDVDALSARAALATAEQEALEGSNAYHMARQRMNHCMGRDLHAELELEGELSFRQIPLYRDKLAKKAMEFNPSLKQLEKIIAQAEFAKEEARRYNYPDFYATAFFEYRDTDKEFSFTNGDDPIVKGRAYGFGVEVELPIFRGLGIAYGKSKYAKKMLKSAKEDYENAKREVSFEIEKTCNEMDEAIRGIYAGQINVEYYNKILNTIEMGLSQGTYQQKDVLEARRNSAGARAKLMKQVMLYNVAKARLDRILGLMD